MSKITVYKSIKLWYNNNRQREYPNSGPCLPGKVSSK
nr:MAG TPA: hypothetical protein [Caudoviricetes sp.]